MVSGGNSSQNIFNLNFGQFELDKDVRRLSDQIKNLDEKLKALKASFKDHLTEENRLLRDLSQCELEIEGIQQAKRILQEQMQDSSKNGQSLKHSLLEANKVLSTIDQHIMKAEDDTKQL